MLITWKPAGDNCRFFEILSFLKEFKESNIVISYFQARNIVSVCFWGHTWLCSRLKPSSVLRNHPRVGLEGLYVLPGIDPGLVRCKPLPYLLSYLFCPTERYFYWYFTSPSKKFRSSRESFPNVLYFLIQILFLFFPVNSPSYPYPSYLPLSWLYFFFAYFLFDFLSGFFYFFLLSLLPPLE